jgi:hypothetical protein
LTTPYDKGQNDIKKVKDNSRTLHIREAVLYQQPTDAKALYVEIIISSEMSATTNFHFAFKLPSLTSKLPVYLASILEPLPAPFKMMSCFSLIVGPNWCNNDLLRTDTTVYRVSIGRRVIVPPNSMKVAKVQLDKNPDQDLAVQPGYNLKGLPTPNLLLKQSTGMQTILRNSTNNYTEN